MDPTVGSCVGGKNLFSKTVDAWHLGSSVERSAEISAILSSVRRADVVTSMCYMVKRSEATRAKQVEVESAVCIISNNNNNNNNKKHGKNTHHLHSVYFDWGEQVHTALVNSVPHNLLNMFRPILDQFAPKKELPLPPRPAAFTSTPSRLHSAERLDTRKPKGAAAVICASKKIKHFLLSRGPSGRPPALFYRPAYIFRHDMPNASWPQRKTHHVIICLCQLCKSRSCLHSPWVHVSSRDIHFCFSLQKKK